MQARLPSTFVVLACGSLQAAVSVSLNPVADAFVSGVNPAGNFGGAGALEISAAGLAKGEFQSLMAFDFASAKTQFDTTFGEGGWLVDSVSLQLTAANPNNAIFNSSAAGSVAIRWLASDSWSEGTGSPATPGAAGVSFSDLAGLLSGGAEALGNLSFDGGTSGIRSVNLSLTPGFLADVGAGGGATLDLYAGDATVSALFNSRNFGTAANRPVLTVTASAVPEASMSALCALGVMVALRRRR